MRGGDSLRVEQRAFPVPVVPLEYGGSGGGFEMFHAVSAHRPAAPDRRRGSPDGRRSSGNNPFADCGRSRGSRRLSDISFPAFGKLYPAFPSEGKDGLPAPGQQRSGSSTSCVLYGMEQDLPGDRV